MYLDYNLKIITFFIKKVLSLESIEPDVKMYFLLANFFLKLFEY